MSGLPVGSWCDEKGGFRLSCKAGEDNHFGVAAGSGEITMAQAIRRHGRREIWESVGLYAQEEADGTLVVRVVVFNPDWDEPAQIACIRSRPRDEDSLVPLACDLNHVQL